MMQHVNLFWKYEKHFRHCYENNIWNCPYVLQQKSWQGHTIKEPPY